MNNSSTVAVKARSDRTFLLTVAATAIAGCTIAMLVFVPIVQGIEGDSLKTPAGRIIEVIAFIFGMIGALSGTAQVRQMYATRSADDVSRSFLFMLSCSFLAWLSYGILLVNWVMLIVNTVGVTITAMTLLYAIRLQRRSLDSPSRSAAVNPADLLKQSRTIAVVGCSTNEEKPAHYVPKYLQQRGWRIIPVNPTATEILGEKVYRSLAEIPASITVDLVDVFRPAAEAPGVVKAAIDAQMPAVWLQLGITSEAARHMATGSGIAFVQDECTWALAKKLDLYAPDFAGV